MSTQHKLEALQYDHQFSQFFLTPSSSDSQTAGPRNRPAAVKDALELLEVHYEAFNGALPYAEKYGHPHPTDTRGWSQILVSALTGILGLKRKKGADLADGSDVKAASTWGAIDTPRFNGVLKAGTKADHAGTMDSLKGVPYLFLVLWDHEPASRNERCRIWAVRPQHDIEFRRMAAKWFALRKNGKIVSDNFQLHPPRNLNSNLIRNQCGTLNYPLLFEARRRNNIFECVVYNPKILKSGSCKREC